MNDQIIRFSEGWLALFGQCFILKSHRHTLVSAIVSSTVEATLSESISK